MSPEAAGWLYALLAAALDRVRAKPAFAPSDDVERHNVGLLPADCGVQKKPAHLQSTSEAHGGNTMTKQWTMSPGRARKLWSPRCQNFQSGRRRGEGEAVAHAVHIVIYPDRGHREGNRRDAMGFVFLRSPVRFNASLRAPGNATG
jgi:hypothetical protein